MPGIGFSRFVFGVAGLCALAATARAEALRPSAAQLVETSAGEVTAGLRDVIASTTTAQGERLRGLMVDDPSRWGIRYRDGYLLFSIPVRKNLTLREKQEGEREAKDLALVTLGQKFSRLLQLEDASQGLDADAVRVILIEPDAERPYVSGLGGGAYGGASGGAAGAAWGHGPVVWAAPCLPMPTDCGCH